MDALLSEFNELWNTERALENLGEPDFGCKDYELLEELQELTAGFWDEPMFPGLRSTRDFGGRREPKFGVSIQLLVRTNTLSHSMPEVVSDNTGSTGPDDQYNGG